MVFGRNAITCCVKNAHNLGKKKKSLKKPHQNVECIVTKIVISNVIVFLLEVRIIVVIIPLLTFKQTITQL